MDGRQFAELVLLLRQQHAAQQQIARNQVLLFQQNAQILAGINRLLHPRYYPRPVSGTIKVTNA